MKLETKTEWIVEALEYANKIGVDLINLSNGELEHDDKALTSKIEELIGKGIVIVAAAGNEGSQFGTINNPANIPGVIAVGSVSPEEKRVSGFSSRGFVTIDKTAGVYLIKPDIVTYGENIVRGI